MSAAYGEPEQSNALSGHQPDYTALTDARLEQRLALVFAPLDKRALGIGVGTAVGIIVAATTAISLLRESAGHFPLALLNQVFYGYHVSVTGILIGAAWGFVMGFIWGWFVAFIRNFALAFWLMTVRVRADLAVSREFLDHL